MTTHSLDLAGLIGWLRTQAPEQTYQWADQDECIVARFVRAVTGGQHNYRPADFGYLLGQHYIRIAASVPHTYGAALERALAA